MYEQIITKKDNTIKKQNKEKINKSITQKKEEPYHQNIYLDEIYIDSIIEKINNANNFDEIQDIFKNVKGNRYFLDFTTNDLYNAMISMTNYLTLTKYNLSYVGKKQIFDKLLDFYIKKYRRVIPDNKLLGLRKKMENNILNDINNRKDDIRSIVADMMMLVNNNGNYNPDVYRYAENKLLYQAINEMVINDGSNIKAEHYKSGIKNIIKKPININNNKVSRFIHYVGSDYNFYTKLSILKDREKLIEKRQQYEIEFLDNKYGKKRGWGLFAMINKGEHDINADNNLMSLPRRNLTHQEKMYNKVYNFYKDRKIKLDKEKSDLVYQHKIRLRDDNSSLRIKKMYNYACQILGTKDENIKILNTQKLKKLNTSIINKPKKLEQLNDILDMITIKSEDLLYNISIDRVEGIYGAKKLYNIKKLNINKKSGSYKKLKRLRTFGTLNLLSGLRSKQVMDANKSDIDIDKKEDSKSTK